jgi:2-amino-4-hydroxy-6-hydroxymethyldihydropteridine diphosphokinase
MRYFLGLGSNIVPRQNLPLMIAALLDLAPTLHVGRVVETAPVGLAGELFLNAPVCLASELAPDALKAWTNALEARLGRDRADPGRSHRSRTADLDALFWLPEGDSFVPPGLLPAEPYMRPMLLELLAYLGLATRAEPPALGPGVALALPGPPGLRLGERPTTIHRGEPRDR